MIRYGSLMNLKTIKKYMLYVKLLCLLPLILAVSTGCKRSQPTEKVVTQHCEKKIKSYFKRRPLSILEQRFFTDRRVHNVLKIEQLKLAEMQETSTSATISVFQLNFAFKDPTSDKPIVLHNNENTGGISLKGPNKVTYRIRCRVHWSLFKSKVIQERLAIKQIHLNSWQVEMNQFLTGSELMDGENELE